MKSIFTKTGLLMRVCGAKIKKHTARLPMMRIVALVVMLMITVSSVATVLAAVKDVTVTINGVSASASAIAGCSSEEEARDLLAYLGYDIPEGSRVEYSTGEESGDIHISVYTPQRVSIKADGAYEAVSLLWGETVEDALEKTNVTLDSNDLISPALSDKILGDTTVEVSRRFAVKVNADGETREVVIPEGDVNAALKAAGVSLEGEDFLDVEDSAPIKEGMEISVSRVTYETKTREETIDYKTIQKDDSSILKGETKVETEGQEGLRKIETQYKYIDGELAETKEISNTVTKEPVDKVVLVGTKKKVSYSAVVNGGTVYDQNGNPVQYTRMLSGRCSAYTGGGICSTGLAAAVGRVAVNPNVIPYGTKLFICSPDGKIVYGYAVAADTGGGCMRGLILADLYMDTLSECRNFGSRTMNIYVLG